MSQNRAAVQTGFGKSSIKRVSQSALTIELLAKLWQLAFFACEGVGKTSETVSDRVAARPLDL